MAPDMSQWRTIDASKYCVQANGGQVSYSQHFMFFVT